MVACAVDFPRFEMCIGKDNIDQRGGYEGVRRIVEVRGGAEGRGQTHQISTRRRSTLQMCITDDKTHSLYFEIERRDHEDFKDYL